MVVLQITAQQCWGCQSRSHPQSCSQCLLWQGPAPAVPEEDQNIPLVGNHDMICPLGWFLSASDLQRMLGHEEIDICYFIALSKVTLKVLKNIHISNIFFFIPCFVPFCCCEFCGLYKGTLLWFSLVFPFRFLGCPISCLQDFTCHFTHPDPLYLCRDLFIFILILTVLAPASVSIDQMKPGRLLLPSMKWLF